MSEALRVDPAAAGPALAHDLPADPAEAREAVQRAAGTVGTFAEASALDALDALLAQPGPERTGATPAEIARQTCQRTELLDREVARFRRLASPLD